MTAEEKEGGREVIMKNGLHERREKEPRPYVFPGGKLRVDSNE
jgi:hypothetical protein